MSLRAPALLALLLGLLFAAAVGETIVQPVTYTAPMCGDDFAIGAEQTYTYKDVSHPVCLVINGTTKAVFFPIVDTFTLLEINNCAFQILLCRFLCFLSLSFLLLS
jgi:hypothetical protein